MSSLQNLSQYVIEGEEDAALDSVKKILAEEVPVDEIIKQLTAAMKTVGERFASWEIFLPDMLLAARAMQTVMKEIEPVIKASGAVIEKKGTVVIGAVEGDLHEIGKNIVIAVMQAQGFEIHDLGIDVSAQAFVQKAEEVGADVIGVSSLMTTTMPKQKEIISLLEEQGIRDKYHVILGGAPVTREWVEETGADSWGESAGVTIDILEKLARPNPSRTP